MSAGGSQAAVPRTRSFSVSAYRPNARRFVALFSDVLVFHAFPLDEAQAKWLDLMLPRIDSQGRRLVVEVEELA